MPKASLNSWMALWENIAKTLLPLFLAFLKINKFEFVSSLPNLWIFTVKCLVKYPFHLSALLPLYDLVWRFDKESVCLCMNSSCLPGQTVKLSRITATKPTSRLNKLTRLAKTFQQFGFSTLSCQTNRQVEWILD